MLCGQLGTVSRKIFSLAEMKMLNSLIPLTTAYLPTGSLFFVLYWNMFFILSMDFVLFLPFLYIHVSKCLKSENHIKICNYQ